MLALENRDALVHFTFLTKRKKRFESTLASSGSPQTVVVKHKDKFNPLNVSYRKVTSVIIEDRQRQKSEYTLLYRPAPIKRIGPPFLNLSLGYTSLAYLQTYFNPFSQTSVTAKIGYQQPLTWKNWDIALNTFFTTHVLSSNYTGAAVRFLGVNARLGYTFESIKDPFRLSLLGGWYYTTTFVQGTTIGYQNLQGPQIFPALKYKISDTLIASNYFKYSPITNSLDVLPILENREIAYGLGFTKKLTKFHSLGIYADFAKLSFTFVSRLIESNTSSFSIGYSYSF